MERLSSRLTLWWKVIFPVVWIGGFLLTDIFIFAGAFNPTPPFFRSLFPAITFLGSAFIFWSCMPLKNVSREGQYLVVSGIRNVIRVPLSNVAAVSQIPFLSPITIVVRFKTPTEFGESIRFTPRFRWEGPAVGALREAVRQANTGGNS